MITERWYRRWGWLTIALMISVGVGCASKSTIESRRGERAVAYAGLSAEHRELVDQGQIRVGMNPDAIYIAWGEPDQVLQSGDATGERTTWLYHGSTSDDYLYWRYYPVPHPDGSTYLSRRLERDVRFREYVAAEIVFFGGKVEKWRTMAKPSGETMFSSGGWVY